MVTPNLVAIELVQTLEHSEDKGTHMHGEIEFAFSLAACVFSYPSTKLGRGPQAPPAYPIFLLEFRLADPAGSEANLGPDVTV